MDDPNFPSNLAIQPSQPTGAQNLRLDQKSSIEIYGIAGRVWQVCRGLHQIDTVIYPQIFLDREAAYALATYTTSPTGEDKLNSSNDSNNHDIEFDPPCSLFRADSNLTVIEVGSGTGYAGMHLAQQLSLHRQRRSQHTASDVIILTDLSNVVSLLDNGLREHAESFGQVEVQAQALAWGDAGHAAALAQRLGEDGRSATHVLCSDLVYFPFLYPPLLRTLLAITSPPFCRDSTPEVIIGYKTRSLAKESPFWQVFGTWFTFEPVLAREDDGRGNWSRFGQGNDTLIFVATRRPESLEWEIPKRDSQLMSGYGPTTPTLDDTFESLLMFGIADDV